MFRFKPEMGMARIRCMVKVSYTALLRALGLNIHRVAPIENGRLRLVVPSQKPHNSFMVDSDHRANSAKILRSQSLTADWGSLFAVPSEILLYLHGRQRQSEDRGFTVDSPDALQFFDNIPHRGSFTH